jgi:hypothetical protein
VAVLCSTLGCPNDRLPGDSACDECGGKAPGDCAWCGAEIGAEITAGTTDRPYPNRHGEVFCRKSHREASNAARRALEER